VSLKLNQAVFIPVLLLVFVLAAFSLAACSPQPAAQPTSTTAPKPSDTNAPQSTATIAPLPADTLAPQATNTAIPPTDTGVPQPTDTQAPSGAVSFANDVLPILQGSCAGCHSAGGGSAGLDLTSYNGVMAGARGNPVVVPGDANNSLLVGMVSSGRMPRGGPKLANEQIQKIIDWINAGADNN
jgi:mono/diheme cytochrome c family protein